MVEVQRLSGWRPQDVVLTRRIDIDTAGPVWEYRPSRYDDPGLERVICLGPNAQAFLRPFLDRPPEAFLFNPRDSKAERNRRKHTIMRGAHGPARRRAGRRTSGVRRPSAYATRMKDARVTIPTPALLAKVVDMIDDVPMEDRDTKGDLYEYMLAEIAQAGQNGQFRTPRHIIRLMVEMGAPTPIAGRA